MAYTNETTHYGIPLPLGSDLTTPMDYNTAMQAVDTALFESKTDSSSALQKANQLQEDLADTKDDVTALTGRVTSAEGTITTQGNAIIQNTQDIADVRADALDMICAVDEGTAQVASIGVTEGNYFRYNDVLYIATANIAVGDTIVPNTNCRATNVATEIHTASAEIDTKQNSAYNFASEGANRSIEIPATAHEAVAFVGVSDTGFYIPITVPDIIIRSATKIYMRGGQYYNATDNSSVQISAQNGVLTLEAVNFNTQDVTSVSSFSVYYR